MRPLICLTLAFAALGITAHDVRPANQSPQAPRTASQAVLASLTGTPPPDKEPAAAAQETSAALPPVRLCHALQMNAMGRQLPALFFVRLIWKESRFDHRAVSKRGAQGIAQFMPPTAKQWGLHNPFDPAQALRKSAELLAYLTEKFGNIGLAAAAYNAGPARVRNWLKGKGSLPKETQDYVAYTTGRPAEHWRDAVSDAAEMAEDTGPPQGDFYSYALEDWCLQLAAKVYDEPWPHAAWNVRVAEDVSQAEALRKVERLRRQLAPVAGRAVRPLLEPLDKTEADGRPRFAVDIGLGSRERAWSLCAAMRWAGEDCRILRG